MPYCFEDISVSGKWGLSLGWVPFSMYPSNPGTLLVCCSRWWEPSTLIWLHSFREGPTIHCCMWQWASCRAQSRHLINTKCWGLSMMPLLVSQTLLLPGWQSGENWGPLTNSAQEDSGSPPGRRLSYQEHCGSAKKSNSAEGIASVSYQMDVFYPNDWQLDLGSEVTERRMCHLFPVCMIPYNRKSLREVHFLAAPTLHSPKIKHISTWSHRCLIFCNIQAATT